MKVNFENLKKKRFFIMKAKKDFRQIITLNATESELKMLEFIMEKDRRFTKSDCLRILIHDRYFFLKNSTHAGVNALSDQRA
jgi:hypothetical protein